MTIISKLFKTSSVNPKDSDEALMKVICGDNQQLSQLAFAEIFKRYKDKVMGYCVNMVKNRNVAEELAHEIFLKAYRNRESYDNQYKFSTWFWTIAKNTCLDYLKKKKDYSLEDMYVDDEGESTNYEEVLADGESSIEEKLINEANKEMIQKCLDNMKEAQREAIVLRVFSELGHKEIADELKISESAAKSLINRAKVSLVECVQKCMKDEEHE